MIFKDVNPIDPVDPKIDIFFSYYIKYINKIIPTGTPKRIPSNLSRIPPCPGRKLPVSLILAFLFK